MAIPSISRRQLLTGAAVAAGVALVPNISRDTPHADALPNQQKKYHYALNPRTNTHRFGVLRTPSSLFSSVPVAVLIHGGSWETGASRDLRFLADFLVRQGVATWNIEYRSLGNDGGWPTTYADVCDAIDHLLVLKLSAAQNLDLDRVYLVGHSAGAQLGALAVGQSPRKVDISGLLKNTSLLHLAQERVQIDGLRGDSIIHLGPALDLEESPRGPRQTSGGQSLIGTGNEAGQRIVAPEGPRIPIHGFVSLNGVLDVVDSANRSKFSNIREFLGGSPHEVPANYAAANPMRHIPHNKRILVVQGGRDYMIPAGQASRFVNASKRNGNRTRYLPIPNARHNDFLIPTRNPKAFEQAAFAVLNLMEVKAKPVSSFSRLTL